MANTTRAEDRVNTLQREVHELQTRERAAAASIPGLSPTGLQRGYSLPSVGQSSINDRQTNQQYEVKLRGIHQQLRQSYEMQVQKMQLNYKHALLEHAQRRYEEKERKSWKSNDFGAGRVGDVLIVTTPTIPGFRIQKVCGTVTGSHASLTISGEATDAKALHTSSDLREQALADLILEAKKTHANAIVKFRWYSRTVGYDTIEMYASGTALEVEREKQEACLECGIVGKKGGKGITDGKQGGEGEKKGKKSTIQGKQQDMDKSKEKVGTEAEEEGDSPGSEEGEEEGNNTKVQKGKNKTKNGEGGVGKSSKSGLDGLNATESLIKLLMDMKLKEHSENKATAQKDALMDLLQVFFEAQNRNLKTEPPFEWTKSFFQNDRNVKSDNSKSEGWSKNETGNEPGKKDAWQDKEAERNQMDGDKNVGWHSASNKAETTQGSKKKSKDGNKSEYVNVNENDFPPAEIKGGKENNRQGEKQNLTKDRQSDSIFGSKAKEGKKAKASSSSTSENRGAKQMQAAGGDTWGDSAKELSGNTGFASWEGPADDTTNAVTNDAWS